MNTDQSYKKKSELMLLVLVLVGTFSLIVIPKYNLYSKSLKQEVQVAAAPSVSDLQTVQADDQGDVLGKFSTLETPEGKCTPGRRCDDHMELAPIEQCSVDDAGGTMTGGNAFEGSSFVNVRLNAVVEPFEITTPSVLLQGSKVVDDSRKIISYDYPVYKDSQNLILDDEARRTCAPGVDCEVFDSINENQKDAPFSVATYIEVLNADEGGGNGKGKTVIYSVPSLRSACPKIQEAKANPRKSNQFAVELDVRQQPPTTGDVKHAVSRSFGAIVCMRKPPDGDILDEAKEFKMCITEVKPTDFVVAAVYGIQQWLDCLVGDADCREARVFALRIDPFYGGQMKCAKPECTIRYFEYKYLQNVAPGDAGSQIPEEIDQSKVNVFQPVTSAYYIQTPCKMRINKWGVHKIPCIWDISPYKKSFQIQKAGYMPLDPSMPQTFDEYWSGGVIKELRKRSLACI